MKKYKANHRVFFSQKYCTLLLLQYLGEMSREHTEQAAGLHIHGAVISRTVLQAWESSNMRLWDHETR